MNIEMLQKQLLPVRKRIRKIEFRDFSIEILNKKAIILICAACSISLVNLIVVSFSGNQLPVLWRVVILVMVSADILIKIIANSFKKCDLYEVSMKLDDISNQHNLIATAYCYVDAGKNTSFAELAVFRGFERLKSVNVDDIAGNGSRVKFLPILFAVTMIMACLLNWPIARVVNVLDATLPLEKHQLADVLKAPLPKLFSVNSSNDGETIGKQFQSTPFSNISNIADSDSMAKSQNAAAVNSGNKVNSKNNSVSNKKAFMGDAGELKKTKFQKSGSGIAPKSETSIESDYLSASESLEDDQQNEKANNKSKAANRFNGSRQPFLDDRGTAPGRELGRSGKKGKLGGGRGGLGNVKKNRTTASILSAETIPVFVKGRKNKGKSKSFSVNSPPENSKDKLHDTISVKPSQESEIERYIVSEKLKEITQKYFEELNSYANSKQHSRSTNAN